MREKYLKMLFDEGEYICYGNKYARSVTSLSYGLTGKSYTHTLKSGEKSICVPRELLCINPLKQGTTRKDVNVSCFRNFVFECDDTPSKKKQLSFFRDAKFPVSAVLDSGGKSVHVILSLATPLSEDCLYLKDKKYFKNGVDLQKVYRDIWWRLAKRLTLASDLKVKNIEGSKKVICDKNCSNPSRFSRFPEARRASYKSYQKVLKIKNRIGKEEFQAYLDTCPHHFLKFKEFKKEEYSGEAFVFDRQTFLVKADEAITKDIRFFRENAASSGMHNRLFMFYKHIKDRFPWADAHFLLSAGEELVYPLLLSAGYPESHIYNNDIESILTYSMEEK